MGRLLRRAAAAVSGSFPVFAALAWTEQHSHADVTNGGQNLSGYAPLPVVGGHAGMLKDDEELQVLKPIVGKRGRSESEFYRHAFNRNRRNGPPATFMPQFFGVVSLYSGNVERAEPYLALEDITANFRRPSIMDIKMGVQTWDEDASPAKIEQERSKYPTQQSVGFRLTGMRVWDGSDHRYREHGRAFGYALDAQTLSRAFSEFLWDGQRLRHDVAHAVLARLDDIEAWMERQHDFRFYGSSLLIVYEGDESSRPDDARGAAARAAAVASFVPHSKHGVRVEGPLSAPAPPRVDVRMIDFAHVWPIRDGPQGRDDGYLLGLRSVRAYIEQALRDAEDEEGRLQATYHGHRGKAGAAGDAIVPLTHKADANAADLR